MTMWDTSLVTFKKGALRNITKYSGVDKGKCFDDGFIEKQYGLESIWRIPRDWTGRLEFLEQMDYGSWLYSCDRATLLEFFKDTGIDHVTFFEGYKKDEKTGEYIRSVRRIPVSELPVRKHYGIFEMEIY